MTTEFKHAALRSGKKLNDGLHLTLALLALAALGWIWWKSARSEEKKDVGRGQRSEVRNQRPDVRGQKSENSGQRRGDMDAGRTPSRHGSELLMKPVGQRESARNASRDAAAPSSDGSPALPESSAQKARSTVPITQVEPSSGSNTILLRVVERTVPAPLQKESAEPERETIPGLPAAMARVLEGQLALVRLGISPGSLDGVAGGQTRAALAAYGRKQGKSFGADSNALAELRLTLSEPPLTSCVITSNDLGRLLPLGKTWLAKSQQERMDYETMLELVSERSQSHPNLIRRLNPGIDWSNVVAGTCVRIPSAGFAPPAAKAALVKIFLSARTLEAFDESSNLLAHFPCSIAQRVEKRPVGELHVAVIAPNPNYTFDPDVFPESAEAKELGRKLILQPGPNNPVGTVWIGLDKPGYGIHGTPRPEDVGRTESHGCFRLANWNADYLLRLVTVGTPVIVEP